MKRIILSLGISGLLMAPVFAGPIGLVEGESTFQVLRGGDSFSATAHSPVILNVEDRVSTNRAPARVDASNGETYVVGPNSSLFVEDEGILRLESGALLASLPAGSQTTVRYDTLTMYLVPSSSDMEGGSTNLIVRELDEKVEIEISSVGSQSTAVTYTESEERVATLGSDDVMTFTRLPNGEWTAGAPALVYQQQELDPTTGESLEQDELEGERRRGAFWWLGTTAGTVAAVGVGAAAVGAGGYIFYNEVIDDDDDDRRREPSRRRPFSPIARPGVTPTVTPAPTLTPGPTQTPTPREEEEEFFPALN